MKTEGKVKTAIIPIAGLGTRVFPESLFIQKAFLPVIDKKGHVKPVLLQILEELTDTDIEEIWLVIDEADQRELERIFHADIDEDYEKRLPEEYRPDYRGIADIGKRLHFVIQREKMGFGHAVYQAGQAAGKRPALVLLGDFIYESHREISCARQVIDAYNQSGGQSVVSIKKVSFEDAGYYGILHGTFDRNRTHIMTVDRMVEKPDLETARNVLNVGGSCYATFGQYVLTEKVFDCLKNQIGEVRKKISAGEPWREIDLTNALQEQALNGQLIGVTVDGNSFDVGTPDMYYRTFVSFRGSDRRP